MESFSTAKQDVVTLDPVRLRALRVRRALLKGELARRAGINPTSASQAMNGKRVGVRVARALAAALNVPLVELLGSGPEHESSVEVAS